MFWGQQMVVGYEAKGVDGLGCRTVGPEVKVLDCECENVLCFHHVFFLIKRIRNM